MQVGLKLGEQRNKRTKISQIGGEAKKHLFPWNEGRVTQVMARKAVSLWIVWMVIWKGEAEVDKKRIRF